MISCETAMLLMLVLLPFLAQSVVLDLRTVNVPSCRHCWGKRIKHNLGTIQFCVPYWMDTRRVAGFEGDVRDVITLSRQGIKSELIVYSNMSPSGSHTARRDWLSGG